MIDGHGAAGNEDASDGVVLGELVRLAQQPAGRWLLQFRSRVTAHQYLGLYRLVRHSVSPPASVLDWGVANGHFSYWLLRNGYRATGYSLEALTFEPLLDRHDYRFVLGSDAEPSLLPFPDRSFDAVISVGVLEHVRETGGTEQASLAEIARILKPGGVFVCYHLPNSGSWIEFAARRIPGKYHHRNRYGHRDIRTLAGDAGLSLDQVRRYGFLPRNAWSRVRGRLRHSVALARAWDLADAVLGRIFAPLCMNFLFVAARTEAGADEKGPAKRLVAARQ